MVGISETNVINTQKLADEDTKQENDIEENFNETVETISAQEKISPNAIVTEKRYYKKCDHLIREVLDIPEELINKTEDDLESYYSTWKVEEYSPDEITVYKEFNGICNEHYVIKQKGDILAVYTENEQGILTWEEDTEIETQYLPEEDIEEFKVGKKVVGKTNLYTFLEDYE